MYEKNSISTTAEADTKSQLPLPDYHPESPFMLPGIIARAKVRGLPYLNLISTNPVKAKEFYGEYLRLCHSPHHDPYEHSNFYEASRMLPGVLDELDSFKDVSCIRCGFYVRTSVALAIPEDADPWTKVFFKEEIAKMRPPETRGFMPVRGQFTWTYVCEKCFKQNQ